MKTKVNWSGIAYAGILVFAVGGSAAKADVVTFSGLNGGDNTAFGTYTEGNYTVTPISGSWFQDDTAFGNPTPSIYDGPVGSPGDATIKITSSAGAFTYQSVDFSSNNGASSQINATGLLGGGSVFSVTDPAPNNGFTFATLNSPDSTDPIDTLFLEVFPGSGATSVNLDNIVLNSVSATPEPGTVLLLGAGLLGLAQLRRSRRGSR